MAKRVDAPHDPLWLATYAAMQRGKTGSTWDWYKRMVDDGKAASLVPVGAQIVDKWNADANTQYDVPWDVVHYDTDGSAFLKWHYATPDALPYDQPEAIYVFDGTEQAGVENYILIKLAYGTGWAADAGIAFTLSTVPASGDQLVLSTNTNNSNDPTDGMAWNVYGVGQTTSKQSGTTRNSTSGVKLGETSASGTGFTNGRVNAPQRVVYGYNRWSQSAFRQWLNSTAAAGAWWEPQNIWDRPPALAATIRGFMAGLPAEFLAVVERTTVTTARNTAEGAAETAETTEDYFWLPSLEEMYITPQLADVEGVPWDYYKELAEEAGLSGRFAQSGTYSELISYSIASKSTPVYVRLRSAIRSTAYYAWVVNSSGNVGTNSAAHGFRGCPACKILKSA